jgi:hypothetical protein
MAHTPEPNSFLTMFHTTNLDLPIIDPWHPLCPGSQSLRPIFQCFTDEIYRELLLVSISAMHKSKLTCIRRAAPVPPGAIRCDYCGVSYPTLELRVAILSPSAFAFSTLAVTAFITFWFWLTRRAVCETINIAGAGGDLWAALDARVSKEFLVSAAQAPGLGGGSSERDTTSKGVGSRRGKFSCANGQRLGSQHSRESYFVAGHGARVRRRVRSTRTLAHRQPNKRRPSPPLA